MTNDYRQTSQTPPLKIVYFHGFASSGASGTVEILRKMLPSATVIAPDIPVDPEEALPLLKKLVGDECPDIIIGTSMGGMYAQQMHGHLRLCVNPAFQMSAMSKVLHTGTHKFLNGRKDGQKEFRITRETLRHFNQMERHQFDGITPADRELCHGLFGIKDTTVNPVNAYNAFMKHYAHAERFDGGHQLNEHVLRHTVLPLLQHLLGERLEAARRPPLPDYMRFS